MQAELGGNLVHHTEKSTTMVNKRPATAAMDEAIAFVREARIRLAIAKKVRTSEIATRTEALKAKVAIEVDAEIAKHEEALNVALLNAYELDASVRRISMEAFDSAFDAPVRRIFESLRQDGRWTPRGRLSGRGVEMTDDEFKMPEPMELEEISRNTAIQPPKFTFLEAGRLLGAFDDGEIRADIVELELDPRSSFLREVIGSLRPGTPFATATKTTLMRHAATGKIISLDSNEVGESMVDHPVARWAILNPETVAQHFDTVVARGEGAVISVGEPL